MNSRELFPLIEAGFTRFRPRSRSLLLSDEAAFPWSRESGHVHRRSRRPTAIEGRERATIAGTRKDLDACQIV
jgi:hypothetical protein